MTGIRAREILLSYVDAVDDNEDTEYPFPPRKVNCNGSVFSEDKQQKRGLEEGKYQ